jgi:hypothetical protein
MSNPTRVNTYIDGSAYDNVNWDMVCAGVTAGNPVVMTVMTSNSAYYSAPFTDNQGNTWTLVGGGYTDPVGMAYYTTTAAATGPLTISFNKQGATMWVGAIVREISGLDTPLVDGVPVFYTAADASPQLVLGENSVPNDLLVCDCICFAPVTFGTPDAGWSADVSGTFGGGTIQVASLYQFPGVLSEAGFPAGWQSLTNAFTRRYYMGALALIGVPVTPTVQSFSTLTPQDGAPLTIYGVYFGATQGSNGYVDAEGVTQSVVSWAADQVTVTCRLGKNPHGTPIKFKVVTDAGVASNRRPITSMEAATGYTYKNVTEPYPDATMRLSATAPDLAPADQIEATSNLLVYEDGRFEWAESETSGRARVWKAGIGWGAWGVESFTAVSPSAVLPVYPSDLPQLQLDSGQPTERRAKSTLPSGPEVRRARSQDYHATLSVWTVLTRDQLQTLKTFGKTTLSEWSGWFNASLPGRSGPIYRTFRFMDEPQWQYIHYGNAAGLWRVTAQLEERGRSVN